VWPCTARGTDLGTEPITSLLQRELVILSKNFGHLGRTSWELSRLLLRAREELGTYVPTKGESGTDPEEMFLPSSESDGDPFGPNLQEDYD